MKTSRTAVIALLRAVAEQLSSAKEGEDIFDGKELLSEALGRAKKKGLIKRVLPSTKKGVLAFETNNPEIEKVVFTDLDTDTAKGVIYAVDGSKGWGWDAFHKPVPLFLEPSTKLMMSNWRKKPDLAQEGDTIVNNYLRAFRDVGMVFDGKKTVPLSSLPKLTPKPEPVAPPEPDQAWSVATLGQDDDDNYVVDVQVFSSKDAAMEAAREVGDVYVVRGTQMWNEPLGQVEEHDKVARYLYVK